MIMHLDERITGTTVLTGLIGHPVGHTVSPLLHNSLYTAMGLDGIYLPMEVADENLGDAVKGLKALGFAGFNVTIPYKERVMEYLDGISDDAGLFGAVNTVVNAGGRLLGYNTDGDGFARAFRRHTGAAFAGKKVCVLGAGGAARSIVFKIAMEGALAISIINRTKAKAEALAADLTKAVRSGKVAGMAGSCGITAAAVESGTRDADLLLYDCDIIVNATSVGLYPKAAESPVRQGFGFRKGQIVFDTIYNPARTKFMADAEAMGCRACNGAGMLFYQGIGSFEIWTGKTVPPEITERLRTEFIKYLKA